MSIGTKHQDLSELSGVVSYARKSKLIWAEREINRLAGLLSIPEEARLGSVEIYHDAWSMNLIRGRTSRKVVAAAMYLGCRKHSAPRTLHEIANATEIGRKCVLKTCKLLTKRLGIKLVPASPLDYVNRFCAKLNLENRIKEKAAEIVNDALKNITSGRSPPSTAAAAIYIAAILCDDRRLLKEVAAATGVSDVTLRVRYNEITKELGIKID